MKVFSVNVLDGREIIQRNVLLLLAQVNSFAKKDELMEKFIVVDSYTKKEKKHRASDDIESAKLIRSLLYLRGVEIYRKEDYITFDDIEEVKEELTAIYHMDGTITYLPPFPLTTPDIQRLIGNDIFTMYIVKDEPQRWATFSTDITQYGLKEKPQLNTVASELFGRELYGDVVYVNENLVS